MSAPESKSFHKIRSLEGVLRSAIKGEAPRDTSLPLGQVLLPALNELVDSTIRTVQKISSELRPGVLDYLGLSAAVEWQVKEFREQTGIPCSCEIAADVAMEDRNIATAVFRIFQETLTNIIRHAGATNVAVSLRHEDGALLLEVRDNGRGIEQEKLTDRESFGLLGMRERARYFGGTVEITGEKNDGTTVLVRIPIDGKAEL